jgi:uncharacterized protein YndB with AHSA1/START domain/DNA-binding transcriptional ArsR family regulator
MCGILGKYVIIVIKTLLNRILQVKGNQKGKSQDTVRDRPQCDIFIKEPIQDRYVTKRLHVGSMDKTFKALADPTRRKILDCLNERNGQTLGEICEHFTITRQAVLKHLSLLKTAGLVVMVRKGRESLHYLNPMPISEIYERWIGKYDKGHVQALNTLKKALEDQQNQKREGKDDMEEQKAAFVYVTYINTTPEKLWDAIRNPEFTQQYWGGRRIESDWKVGSPVKMTPANGNPEVLGKVVEYKPLKVLAYTWHSDPESTVTFMLEPYGTVMRLTVTHKGLDPASKTTEQTKQGWVAILSSLKSLLETGKALVYPWKGF